MCSCFAKIDICWIIRKERGNEKMNHQTDRVIVGQMRSRERQTWAPSKKTKGISKQLLRNTGIFAAVSICIGTGAHLLTNHAEESMAVMSHLTAGFDYDESIGRLQFVSNILPESAMVFLNSNETELMSAPTLAEQTHPWSSEEPWIEYMCTGDISACGSGEVVTVVKNRQDEYTVRILHDGGYESVYSGLNAVNINELDSVSSGQQIGTASGIAAFEIRKEGLSVLPVFAVE